MQQVAANEHPGFAVRLHLLMRRRKGSGDRRIRTGAEPVVGFDDQTAAFRQPGLRTGGKQLDFGALDIHLQDIDRVDLITRQQRCHRQGLHLVAAVSHLAAAKRPVLAPHAVLDSVDFQPGVMRPDCRVQRLDIAQSMEIELHHPEIAALRFHGDYFRVRIDTGEINRGESGVRTEIDNGFDAVKAVEVCVFSG